jgi:hypothetical protein
MGDSSIYRGFDLVPTDGSVHILKNGKLVSSAHTEDDARDQVDRIKRAEARDKANGGK